MKNKNSIFNGTILTILAFFCVTIVFINTSGDKRDYFSFAKSDIIITPETTTEDNRLTCDLHLPESDYILKIKYTSDSDTKIVMRSVSQYSAEEDGFPILFTGDLPQGKNEIEFPFTTDDFYIASAITVQSQPINMEVQSISVQSLAPVYIDRYVFSILWCVLASIFAAFAIIIFNSQKSSKEKYHQLAVLLLIAVGLLVATKRSWGNTLIMGDDFDFHFARIESIANAFSIGQVPSMTGSAFNDGFGYMNSAFYPELFLYLPGLLVFLGASTPGAVSVLGTLASLTACLLSYYSFYKISKSRAAAISGTMIYLLSFYRLQNFYVRSAMGEFLFMSFLPLAIYGIYNILFEKEKKWWMLAIACSCVFQSQLLGTVLVAIVGGTIIAIALVSMLIKKQDIKPILMEFVKAAAVIFLLNLCFIIPYLYYNLQNFVLFPTGEVAVQKFISNIIGFKDFALMSPKLALQHNIVRGVAGFSIIITFVVGACLWAWGIITKKIHGTNKFFGFCVLGIILVCTVLATSVSVWQQLSKIFIFYKLAPYIQYAFRLVGIVTFATSLFVCLAMSAIKKHKVRYAVAMGLCVLSVCSGLSFFDNCAGNVKIEPPFHIGIGAQPEYMLEGAVYADIIGRPKKVLPSGEIKITNYKKDVTNIDVTFEGGGASKDEYIDIPLFFYTGYGAYIGGEQLKITMGDGGLMRIMLGENKSGNIHVGYYSFWFFKVANGISLASLVALIGYLVQKRRKAAREPKARIAVKV